METLLLFCCQSCLKGDHDIEYYEILSITPSATSDEIKKAYKKQSLLLHPDRLAQRGIQVTPEHNLKFQQLKEAYDVLSDARKRRLYDKIGKSGLKLVDSPQDINPTELIKNFQQNKFDRMKLFLFLFLCCCSVLILPILFSLKCDGKIKNVPWLALWTPMWVIDAILIIISVLFLMQPDVDDDDEEEGEGAAGGDGKGARGGGNGHGHGHGEGNEEGNDEENHTTNNKQKKKNENKIPIYIKLFFLGRSLSFILLQIFILMKLDDEINWSWFAVFAPWFAYEGLALLDKFSTMIQPVDPPNPVELEVKLAELDDQEKLMTIISAQEEYFKKLMEKKMSQKSFCVSLLRVWLACFLAVQLNQTVNWDWGLVLLPIWVYFVLEIFNSYYFKLWGTAILDGIDLEACANGEVTDPSILLRAQHGQEILAASTVGYCTLAPVVFMAVLLISRLEADEFSTFIILIPIFGLLGCCMCGVVCSFCAFSCVDTEELQAEQNAQPPPPPQTTAAASAQESRYADMEVDMEAGAEMSSSPQYSNTSLFVPEPSPPIKHNSSPTTTAPIVEVTHIDADID